jgi:hypothetical protein
MASVGNYRDLKVLSQSNNVFCKTPAAEALSEACLRSWDKHLSHLVLAGLFHNRPRNIRTDAGPYRNAPARGRDEGVGVHNFPDSVAFVAHKCLALRADCSGDIDQLRGTLVHSCPLEHRLERPSTMRQATESLGNCLGWYVSPEPPRPMPSASRAPQAVVEAC